jgi:hypothetical protein
MKCKNGITLNLKELYDLGIIKKRKKKRRKGKTQGYTKMGEPKSDSSQMVGAGYSQAPIFQNTSNLQNEYMRLRNNQLEDSEPSDAGFQNRQMQYLEDRIDKADGNHEYLTNEATKAIQYLLGNGQTRFDGFSLDDGNDIAQTDGSDYFHSQRNDDPIEEKDDDANDEIFSTPTQQTPHPAPRTTLLGKAQTQMDRFFNVSGGAKIAPFESPIADPQTPEPAFHKRGRGVRLTAIDIHNYRQEAREAGITDEGVLGSVTKKTLTGAIHTQKKELARLHHEYAKLGGIDPDVTVSKNIHFVTEAVSELESRRPVVVKKVRVIKPKKG